MSIKSITNCEEVRKSEWARFEPGICRILTIRVIIWQPNSFDIVSAKIFRSIYTFNNTDEQNCVSLLNQKKHNLEIIVYGQFDKCFQNAEDEQIFIKKTLKVALCRKCIIHPLKLGR